MLSPEYLQDLPEPVLALWRQAEEDILREMARRIQSMEYWVPSVQWQQEKLREAGETEQEILRILSRYTGQTEAALRQLMQEAATEALKNDAAIHEAAGQEDPSFRDSQVLQDKLTAGFLATLWTMRNLTRTTARTATGQFEAALDRAWMQVTSGAFSHQQAVLHAIDSLAKEGIDAIRYPSGHRDTIETAVRRAVVTGVNQTALRCQEALSDEVGCDLVEVTAHEGARPSHAVWQGKIYSRSGESEKYPKLADATGYGTGAGLGGWNCRHSFHPWYEGTPRTWTEEQLEQLKEKDITYNGEQMTRYDASQRQRSIERQLRRWKREYVAREAAGEDTGPAAAKIQAWNAKQKDFLKQTGLKRQGSREEAAGWTGRKATEAWKKTQEGGFESDLPSGVRRVTKSIFSRKKVIAFDDLPAIMKEDFQDGLRGATPEARKALRQIYRKTDYVLGNEDRSFFRSGVLGGTVTLGKSADASTIAHELFHKLDDGGKISGSMLKSLKNDYTALLKRSDGDVESYIASHFPNTVSHSKTTGKVRFKSEYRGISDILNGVSDDKLNFGFKHSSAYWSAEGRKASEAWAQYGRIQYDNTPEAQALLRTLFPSFSEHADLALKELI